MSGNLSSLSEDELTRLRARIERSMRAGTYEQRRIGAEQLEAVDVERERRLSPSLAG